MLSTQILNKVAHNGSNQEAREALVEMVHEWGPDVNLDKDHRILMFVPQVMHEAGNGKWLQELWGPTAAQKRYEGRADLGNVQKGDGYKFRGRGWIQCTGRANYRSLTEWCRELIPNSPDFEVYPDLLSEPKWAAISAFWYWSQRVPLRYVDSGDVDRVTRAINGGYNGLEDRKTKFVNCGLAMLDSPSVVHFQQSHKLVPDGIAGPLTRKAIFDVIKT